MLLDPELAAVAGDFPPSDLCDPVAARETNRKRHAADAAYPATHRVEVGDRSFGGPAGPVPVRVYRSRVAVRPQPAVLWLHGGAFALGDLDASDALCSRISDEVGALVVNVDYRLAPEHPSPAGLHDAYAALQWLAGSAVELGADPRRIAVAGASAGACLAAGVTLMARDAGGPPLTAQLLVQPVLDDRCDTASARGVTSAPVFDAQANVRMWRMYLAGATADGYTAPARTANLAGLPPAFIMAAQHDPLRDEAMEYASRLSAAGVPTELHVVPGTFHGFDSVVPDAAVSRRAREGYVAALARALGTT